MRGKCQLTYLAFMRRPFLPEWPDSIPKYVTRAMDIVKSQVDKGNDPVSEAVGYLQRYADATKKAAADAQQKSPPAVDQPTANASP